MPAIEPIFAHTAPFLLVLFRISGIFIFAPLISSSLLPVRIRLTLALALTIALYPTLPPVAIPTEISVFAFAPLIFQETFIGLVLGLLAAMPGFAVQLAGLVIGQQTGMALGNVFNPALESDADPLSQLLMLGAISIFLALGGLDAVFLAVARSYAFAPIDSAAMHAGALEIVIAVLTAGVEIAIRVSAPVVAILLVETIAGGVIAKVLPQVNLLSIGYGIKVILAFLCTIGAMHAMAAVMRDDAHRAILAMDDFLRTISPAAAPAGAR